MRGNTIPCNAIQRDAMQYTTVHYSTLHDATAQYSTIQNNAIQYNTARYYSTGELFQITARVSGIIAQHSRVSIIMEPHSSTTLVHSPTDSPKNPILLTPQILNPGPQTPNSLKHQATFFNNESKTDQKPLNPEPSAALCEPPLKVPNIPQSPVLQP